MSKLRPEIIDTDRLIKLSQKLNISGNQIVNFFVNIGLEVLETSTDRLIDEIENQLQKRLTELNAKKPKNGVVKTSKTK